MIEYTNKFDGLSEPIDNATLSEVEDELGFVFPKEIREHYISFNGGCPTRFFLVTDDVSTVLSEFMPIRHRRSKNILLLEDVCKDLRNHMGMFPDHLIPFADDAGGNFFCFSTLLGEESAIYFFSTDSWKGPIESAQKVASSLREFIENLKEDYKEDD